MIFNINAAICGLVIWVLVELMKLAFPSLSSLVVAFASSAIVLLIGGAAEWLELKPRLFFLPVWLWGIWAFLRSAYVHLGVYPALVLVALCALAFIAQWQLRRRVTARRMNCQEKASS